MKKKEEKNGVTSVPRPNTAHKHLYKFSIDYLCEETLDDEYIITTIISWFFQSWHQIIIALYTGTDQSSFESRGDKNECFFFFKFFKVFFLLIFSDGTGQKNMLGYASEAEESGDDDDDDPDRAGKGSPPEKSGHHHNHPKRRSEKIRG